MGNYEVGLVLGDCSEVTSQETYWNARPVPHLLTTSTATSSPSAPTAPKSWTTHSHLCKHSDMGGSTDGIHRLMLFVPPSCSTPSISAPTLPGQSWIPLQAALQPVTSPHPATEPHAHEAREGRVYKEGPEVLPFGLFPALLPMSWVGFLVCLILRSNGEFVY